MIDGKARLERMESEQAAIRARLQESLAVARDRVAVLEALSQVAERAEAARGLTAALAWCQQVDVELMAIRTDEADALHRELVLRASRVLLTGGAT